MSATATAYDVIVAGAGFGGLSAAILLGRIGLRVLLVEAERHPGGLLRSYRRGGLDCPVGVHYFGAAGRDELLGQFLDLLGVRDALKLCRMGDNGIIDRYVFDDRTFDLPPSLAEFDRALRMHFPAHAQGIEFLVGALRATIDGLRIGSSGRIETAAIPGASLGASAQSLLVEHGCPEGILRIVAMQGLLTGVDLEDSPFLFPLMSLASLLQSAWRLGCTGADMADALADRARAFGVEIVTRDPVTSVQVDGGRVKGIALQSGRAFAAPQVIAGLHPKVLVDRIGAEHWPAGYRDEVHALEETDGVYGLVALLDEGRHPAIAHNVYRIETGPGGMIDGVYAQIRPSGLPGRTQLVLLTNSHYDAWQPWEHTRTGRRGDDYEERKLTLGRRMIATAEEVLGPLDDAQIVDSWTPLTVRDWAHAPGGGAYGMRHSIRDLKHLSFTRTGIAGLFMVGQSALACGLIGVAVGVMRVAGDVVGRAKFRDFVARTLAARSAEGNP